MSLPANPFQPPPNSALYASVSSSVAPVHSALEDLTQQLCRRIESDRRLEAMKYETMRAQFHKISEEHFRSRAVHERESRAKDEECTALKNEISSLKVDGERLGKLCEELKEEVRTLKDSNEALRNGDAQDRTYVDEDVRDLSSASKGDLVEQVAALRSEHAKWKIAHQQLKQENVVNDRQWRSLVESLRSSLDRSQREVARLKAEIDVKSDSESDNAGRCNGSLIGSDSSSIDSASTIKVDSESEDSRPACFRSRDDIKSCTAISDGVSPSNPHKRPTPPKLSIVTATKNQVTSNGATKRRRKM